MTLSVDTSTYTGCRKTSILDLFIFCARWEWFSTLTETTKCSTTFENSVIFVEEMCNKVLWVWIKLAGKYSQRSSCICSVHLGGLCANAHMHRMEISTYYVGQKKNISIFRLSRYLNLMHCLNAGPKILFYRF